ncbi:MAG TPA: hypothetical protein IAB33_03335 [Candidatus Pelethomonas intestinigallinarum]|nr:hypothetical protein [Candidatus Pelethomonas intestinigallinarum]
MSDKTNKLLYIGLSLLIAVIFWFFVDSEQGHNTTQTYYNIPVEFIGETDTLPSRGLMLTTGADATVDLELRGPRTVISDLSREDITLQVDLTSITATGTFSMTYDLLLPDEIPRSSVTTERASRSTITVTIEELFEKTVPVKVSVAGEVADGYIYMAERMIAEPSELTLSGREEDVDQVVSAQVMLDLSGATSSVNQEFDYILLDGQGNEVSGENITVSSRRIEISAPVYLVKTLELTVDFTESPGSALEDLQDWYLGVTSIEVAGEAANLEGVDDILLATVDLSTLLSDTEMPLEITIPAGCVNISGITSTTLTILFKDTLETRAFTVSNISAIGLSQTQNFSRMTNSVEVLLRGDAQELEQVTADDIRIVVDLTPYEDNGTYSVPAVVLVDGHSNVGAVGTYSVACRITSS